MRSVLGNIINHVSSQVTLFFIPIMPIVASVAIIINICHVAILSKNSVSSSSMNTLLIGIAISDILSPCLYVKWGVMKVIRAWTDYDECFTSSYIEVLVDLILMSVRDNFRRCSMWLGLLLVAIRTISVKTATKKNWSIIMESRFGLKLILIAVFCSLLIMIPYLLRWQIVQSDEHYCSTLSGDVILTSTFSVNESEDLDDISGIGRRIHLIITAFFSKLLCCVLFPIFAFVLLCELSKYEESSASSKTEKISMLTIFMTVSFLSVELPVGVFKALMLFKPRSRILNNLKTMFDFFYVPMTASHAFICFSMSSQYRHTVYKLFNFQSQVSETVLKISAVSSRVQSTSVIVLEKYMFIFSTISILVNYFHIMILLKKSMSSSAVTSLLIGIAIVDIFSPFYYIKIAIRNFIWRGPCIPPRGYLETIFNWLLLTLRDDFRRCSTWFGLDLAVIRMFTMKFTLKKKYDFITEAPFGKKVMLLTFLMSTGIGISYFFRYRIVQDTQWILIPGCATSSVQFMVDEIDGTSNIPARELHLLLTAVFEKILPSIMFPMVALVLIYELKKATNVVNHGLKTSSTIAGKRAQKTNKLVICMTITFIIIELPIGICKLVTATRDSYEDAVISESIAKLLNMIYVPMTCSHCVICVAMSSQYRITVFKALGISHSMVNPHESAVISGNI